MKLKTKDILRIERIKRGWTQAQVAEYLGIARGSYAKYETGANIPTTENIVKLAELYRVTTDYLLCCDYTTALKQSFKQGYEAGEAMGDDIVEGAKQRKRVRKKKST